MEFRYSIRPHGAIAPLEAMRFGIERSQPLLASAPRTRRLPSRV